MQKPLRRTTVTSPDLHEGEPKALRENPPAGLGDLRLNQVIMKMEEVVTSLDEKPIMIGQQRDAVESTEEERANH